MKRVSFFAPGGNANDPAPEIVARICSLVEETHITPEKAAKWTPLERLMVYDYAMRVHLGASDNSICQRSRPSILSHGLP